MKKVLKYLFLVALLVAIYAVYTNYPKLNIIAGYSSKNMASSVFLANRDIQYTDEVDNSFTPINLATDKVNKEEKFSTASVFGLLTRKAIYREGLGAVLVPKNADENSEFLVPKRNITENKLPFPYGNLPQKDTVFENVNYNLLETAVDSMFNNNKIKQTRSVLVIYKDQIIAEKYANGFDKDSKLLGWSMTKSITATLFGILQKQGKININDKAPIESWKNDDRAAITINDLLHMNSGLAWEEDYKNISDVTRMLFLTDDMTKIQEEKPLVGKPNESWNYSSGTTNLLSGILRKQFDTHQEYLDFWYAALIDKIGMHSMLIETDMSGNYVGSSYGWATTRDWAKFGLLYLHKGNWNGEQIFDTTWVDYVKTPTNGSNGEYGGHFWLNAGGKYPDVPKDIYSANGYQGQRVFIVPSKDLVIVRMGLTNNDNAFDFNTFLKEVLVAIN
ncbi:class C beta-lactamase-related serine hydrolase [Aureibaculum marinum]|uniref:Class C beta-lactamase-related serine hydrolase n=1 Tax=Aureibaculum marinum TaxID=2487930 RepID=A0A3N4N794_9FLAO|nr:serine hydrolase [Aureibaculum marinum]RPD91245.1 class C beta-lactamase-related serine hydrolase [Aureibaculum marinum]